jgi:hypothetical protein
MLVISKRYIEVFACLRFKPMPALGKLKKEDKHEKKSYYCRNDCGAVSGCCHRSTGLGGKVQKGI